MTEELMNEGDVLLPEIIQGGMGIMISGPKLAGAVAAAGGIGTIASVGLAVASSDCSSPLLSAYPLPSSLLQEEGR